MAFKGEMHLHT